jgi:type II secretory pathway pseudopilin PulG
MTNGLVAAALVAAISVVTSERPVPADSTTMQAQACRPVPGKTLEQFYPVMQGWTRGVPKSETDTQESVSRTTVDFDRDTETISVELTDSCRNADLLLLAALLLPALQASRESSRRMQCANKIRQLELALQSYESSQKHYPTGSDSKPYPAFPQHPYTFYRWSTLSHLTPYMEQSAVYNMLRLDLPLYNPSYDLTEENKPAVSQMLPEFLCPSDRQERLNKDLGPTNYAGCAGSGKDGGTPHNTDGTFFVNSKVRASSVTDGLSKTASFSESTLGDSYQGTRDPTRVYAYVFAAPVTESACDQAFQYNVTDPRGFSWANGEIRSALYNHFAPPNSPTRTRGRSSLRRWRWRSKAAR